MNVLEQPQPYPKCKCPECECENAVSARPRCLDCREGNHFRRCPVCNRPQTQVLVSQVDEGTKHQVWLCEACGKTRDYQVTVPARPQKLDDVIRRAQEMKADLASGKRIPWRDMHERHLRGRGGDDGAPKG